MMQNRITLPEYDLVILGLARNCEHSLPKILKHIDWLRESGLSVLLIVGEDGSRDKTRGLLLSSGPDTLLVDTTQFSEQSRLVRIARAREKVLEKFREGYKTKLVAVVDMDSGFATSITAEAISEVSRELLSGHFFAVAATSQPYYDLLAFDSWAMPNVDFMELEREAKRNFFSFMRFKYLVVHPRQRKLTTNHDMRAVSAFNGLCFYEPALYLESSYIPLADDDWPCEHVTFNKHLAAKGLSVLVKSSLIVTPPSEHVYSNPFKLICQVLVKKLKSFSR